MKIITTLTVFLLCFLTLLQTQAQESSDASAETTVIVPKKTPKLEALYAQEIYLEKNGTALEIQANRLAIKAAWQEISPEIAGRYKPIDNQGMLPHTQENYVVNGTYYPDMIHAPRVLEATRDWDTDRLLIDTFIDGGVDIEVTQEGDIYISAYQNNIDFGGEFDILYIYRSLNGGQSFEQWKEVLISAPLRKMQIISIDGAGEEYIVAYLLTAANTFEAWRWSIDGTSFSAEGISNDVTDFSVDRNFPVNTNSQRVFATYLKDEACTTEVFSARSTAGSYGLDWVDETSIDNVCGDQIDIAYGRDGSIYTTYTGAASGNLYVNVNNNYNDPASWTPRETVTTGATEESLNPAIAATRNLLATDNVVLATSQRNVGNTDGYRFRLYTRENGAAFSSLFNGVPIANQSAIQPDLWVRKQVNANDIRTATIFEILDASSSNRLASRTYDGVGYGSGEGVSDTDVDVWEGFPAAVAETSDNMPCMAFAGTSPDGSSGQGLYFDAKAEIIILNTESNAIDGLAYYPNPTQAILHIQAKNTIENVALYTITGAKIIEQKEGATNKTILNMGHLATGTYLLKVQTGKNQVGTYRIIKQ